MGDPVGFYDTAGFGPTGINLFIELLFHSEPLGEGSDITPYNGALPDSFYSSKAPDLTTPGTMCLVGVYVNDRGRPEPWEAYFDAFGRQVGRTDYNAGNQAQGIPDTHYHSREYSASFPEGRSTGDHLPGRYLP